MTAGLLGSPSNNEAVVGAACPLTAEPAQPCSLSSHHLHTHTLPSLQTRWFSTKRGKHQWKAKWAVALPKRACSQILPGPRHNSFPDVVRHLRSQAVPHGQDPSWAGWWRKCLWAWWGAGMVWWTSEDVIKRAQNQFGKDMKIILSLKEFALETHGEHISWLQLTCFLQNSRKKEAKYSMYLSSETFRLATDTLQMFIKKTKCGW